MFPASLGIKRVGSSQALLFKYTCLMDHQHVLCPIKAEV